MKILASILSICFVLAIVYFVYALDDWVGILVFKYYYIGTSLGIAVSAFITLASLTASKKTPLITGLVAFAILMAPLVREKPSARILREVMLKVQPETDERDIEKIVQQAYSKTKYVMPKIIMSENEICVSLVSQDPGDYTAVIFHIEDKLVKSSKFSAD